MSIQSKDSHVCQKSRDSTANHIFSRSLNLIFDKQMHVKGHRTQAIGGCTYATVFSSKKWRTF